MNPAAEAGPEDILLDMKMLPTDHNYSLSVDVNYAFGSICSNVVNPHFGN